MFPRNCKLYRNGNFTLHVWDGKHFLRVVNLYLKWYGCFVSPPPLPSYVLFEQSVVTCNWMRRWETKKIKLEHEHDEPVLNLGYLHIHKSMIYVATWLVKKHPSTSYPAAKHPKQQVDGFTQLRKPVIFCRRQKGFCFCLCNNFAYLDFYAKVSITA